jgi:hypothetical protein
VNGNLATELQQSYTNGIASPIKKIDFSYSSSVLTLKNEYKRTGAQWVLTTGFEWTLLCLGKNKTPTLPESDTLNVLNLNSEEARDLYGADFVLIRPDQIVAWRGNAAAGAVAALKGITEA